MYSMTGVTKSVRSSDTAISINNERFRLHAIDNAAIGLRRAAAHPVKPTDHLARRHLAIAAGRTVRDRLAINGDVAYLPYARFTGLDSHLVRMPVAFFPQDGTGRGVQTELILTYGRKFQCRCRRTLLGDVDGERQPELQRRLH